ncbi:MAG TPA: transposase [Bacteroidales bacterium]|nr:transposase [Bacteroidales bacterium]
MSHTYSRIWMHYITHTKNNQPLLSKTLIPLLIEHFKDKYKTGGEIYVNTANGVADHFHLLVGQIPTISPSKVANLIKGESSHWINSNDFIPQKFAWQDGFSVFSVSHSMVQAVRNYILNQEEHHRTMTYEEEVRRFLKAHDIEINLRNHE